MRRTRGFTVLEMMFAVAVIGLVCSVGVTQYLAYAVRAKRTEAYLALAAVRTGQDTYFLDEDQYAGSFADIDLDIPGGKPLNATSYQGKRYAYNLSQPWGAKSYYCTATGNLDGDPWLDVVVTWGLQQ